MYITPKLHGVEFRAPEAEVALRANGVLDDARSLISEAISKAQSLVAKDETLPFSFFSLAFFKIIVNTALANALPLMGADRMHSSNTKDRNAAAKAILSVWKRSRSLTWDDVELSVATPQIKAMKLAARAAARAALAGPRISATEAGTRMVNAFLDSETVRALPAACIPEILQYGLSMEGMHRGVGYFMLGFNSTDAATKLASKGILDVVQGAYTKLFADMRRIAPDTKARDIVQALYKVIRKTSLSQGWPAHGSVSNAGANDKFSNGLEMLKVWKKRRLLTWDDMVKLEFNSPFQPRQPKSQFVRERKAMDDDDDDDDV